MALLLAEVAQRTRADHVAEARAVGQGLTGQAAAEIGQLFADRPWDAGFASLVAARLDQLGERSSWELAVYQSDGEQIARYPATASAKFPRPWPLIATADEGAAADDPSVEAPQIWAWTHVPRLPLVVVASQPLVDVLADWRRKVFPAFLFGLVAVGGLALLGALAVKWSQIEQRTQEQLIKSSQALEMMLEEKDALLAEIHHRVKNNMQVVVTLLQMEAAGLTDDATRRRLDEMGRRIALIGRIHERIYAAERFSRMDVAAHLTDHCAELAALHGDRPLAVHADALSCGLDTALPVSLIAHELVSNALRRDGGDAVSVDLTRKDGVVTLIVEGRGTEAESLSTVLIRVLAEQIGATIEERREPRHRVTVAMPTDLFVQE